MKIVKIIFIAAALAVSAVHALAVNPAVEPRAKTIEVVAATLYYEARGEIRHGGIEAVASVIFNRAHQKRWSKLGYSGVCLQKKQFSCFNGGFKTPRPSNKMDKAAYAHCVKVATKIADGSFIPVHSGNHYCTVSCKVYWKKQLRDSVIIGNHVFGTL